MKYDLIYMDPPWRYNLPGFQKQGIEQGTCAIQYDTMTLEELIDFGKTVDEFAKEDCALFMWVTNPRQDWGFKLGEEWGWRFSTIPFTWIKTKPSAFMEQRVMFPPRILDYIHVGMGFHTSQNKEDVLLFKRGKVPAFGERMIPSLCFEPIREHSRKPDEIRKRIERAYPAARRLEMFARETCTGWDSWGNETTKFGGDA